MRIIGALGAFILAALFPITTWAEPIGWITAVDGAPTMSKKSATPSSLSLSAQGILATEAGFKVKALMKGDTVLTLAGETQLQVGKGKATLREGTVRVLVGGGGVSSYEVHTPTARASTPGGYFIAWTTECEGSPATGILVLSGSVMVSDLNGAKKVALNSNYYTYIGDQCPNPLPLPASQALYAGLVASTELNDQVRTVVAEVSEGAQIDAQEKGVPIFFPQARRRSPSVPPIAQTGPLSLLTRVRVNIDFR